MQEKALSREEFNRVCLKRDHGRCVFCENAANQVHHILDRKLWPDRGGYYESNGASVCEECHMKCENCTFSVELVREKCGITNIILPPDFDPAKRYDKWGDVLLLSGYKVKGPLFEDDAVQKLFKRDLWLFLDSEDEDPGIC